VHSGCACAAHRLAMSAAIQARAPPEPVRRGLHFPAASRARIRTAELRPPRVLTSPSSVSVTCAAVGLMPTGYVCHTNRHVSTRVEEGLAAADGSQGP